MRLWRDTGLFGGLELLRAYACNHRYPAHQHGQFVIAIFERGAQRHRIEHRTGIAHAGAIMIIPPGEVHMGEAAEQNGTWDYSAFYPGRNVLERIADDILGETKGELGFGPNVLLEDPSLAATLLDAHRTAEAQTDALTRQCAIIEAFADLVARHGRRDAPGRASRPASADIRRAIEFVNDEFDRPLTVGGIAEVAGLSEFHFMRTFKDRTGLTVHRYLIQLRLDRAKDLLQKGMTAAETAIAVGFFDQSHLTNQFRNHFGVTPQSFAKACRC